MRLVRGECRCVGKRWDAYDDSHTQDAATAKCTDVDGKSQFYFSRQLHLYANGKLCSVPVVAICVRGSSAASSQIAKEFEFYFLSIHIAIVFEFYACIAAITRYGGAATIEKIMTLERIKWSALIPIPVWADVHHHKYRFDSNSNYYSIMITATCFGLTRHDTNIYANAMKNAIIFPLNHNTFDEQRLQHAFTRLALHRCHAEKRTNVRTTHLARNWKWK